ncbi:hypothetical protein [Campylobacter concisus]|uniref:hypothetical protein n=1 Tax=Campylobacter concisus TaxID=199 RepID=UPI000CD8C253|nr:hypothetical protein [Campylobacter concisus]
MALDCESAFAKEMEKFDTLGGILDRIEKILNDHIVNKPEEKKDIGSLDETNRLLKILCKNLVGKE